MTTGRINQVTTIPSGHLARKPPSEIAPRGGVGVSSTQIDRRHVKSSRGTHPSISAQTVLPRSPAMPSHLVPPISHVLGELLPFPLGERGWLPSKKTTSNQKTGHVLSGHSGSSKSLIASGLATGDQPTTFFPTCKTTQKGA